MPNPSYLTKTRFKLGWECPTKLYYAGHPDLYFNSRAADTFMQGLAEGGYQVGEFARWMLCADPEGDAVATLDKGQALQETRRRLEGQHASVAEAAFMHGGLFIRADVVIKDGSLLKLYEVKSKSWDASAQFWTKRGERRLASEWEPYLLDVAFQKLVVEQAFPDLTVQAFLVLLDKDKTASVDGLSQAFQVLRQGNRLMVRPRVTARQELGTDLLAYVSVDRDIEDIRRLPFELLDGTDGDFRTLIGQMAEIVASGRQHFSGVGSKCRQCEFCLPADPQRDGLRSGMDECWAQAVEACGRTYDKAKPKAINVWNYRKSDEMIGCGKLFVEDLSQDDIGAGKQAGRQWLQVQKVRDRDTSPWIDVDGLRGRMASWRFPLHFIDFETARLALPSSRGMAPYTQVAFQFSHHTVDRDGGIRHVGQWVETRPGQFPSFAFVRALKRELDQDEGTIFRYAAHENTVLRDILGQLEASSEPDRHDLIRWIATITEYKPEGGKTEDKIRGARNMVDMKDLVVGYYYDPATQGSNSLKAVLPAVIANSEFLRSRYGHPIRDSGIHSLNYPGDWVWVRADAGSDPYAALPPLFADRADLDLSEYVRGMEKVDDGGAATIAYAKLQFFDLPEVEREAIRAALLRYCELDTLAMVMLYGYWRHAVEH